MNLSYKSILGNIFKLRKKKSVSIQILNRCKKTSVHVSNSVCGLSSHANSTCLSNSVHFLFYKLLVIETAASDTAAWTMGTNTGKSTQGEQGDFSTPRDGFCQSSAATAFYSTLGAERLVSV